MKILLGNIVISKQHEQAVFFIKERKQPEDIAVDILNYFYEVEVSYEKQKEDFHRETICGLRQCQMVWYTTETDGIRGGSATGSIYGSIFAGRKKNSFCSLKT